MVKDTLQRPGRAEPAQGPFVGLAIAAMALVGWLAWLVLGRPPPATHGRAPEYEYALVRNSLVGENELVRIATFDYPEESSMNRENCEIAANLFESQPGVGVDWFCIPAADQETESRRGARGP